MGDVEDGAVAVRWQPSAGRFALASAVALPSSLLVPPTFAASDAIVTVGLVLTEAIALSVGYGTLTRIASPAVRELLASG